MLSLQIHVIDAVVTINVKNISYLKSLSVRPMEIPEKALFQLTSKQLVPYEEIIQELSVALNTVGTVCVKRTHDILFGAFNIPIASGT